MTSNVIAYGSAGNLQADIALAVVIPAYRQPGLLPEALHSVLSQRSDFAIGTVVVDDGCPFAETRDAALTFARRHPGRVCYIRTKNAGLSAARNAGIAFALRAWPMVSALYMLDADNRLHPHFLARAFALLNECPPDVGWLYPDFDMFGTPLNHSTQGAYSLLMLLLANYCEAGSLVRRSVFEAGVRFDETMRSGQEDWDFWLQAAGAGFRGRHLPRSGFQYRKRLESMLSESNATRSATLAAMRQKHGALMQPRALIALSQEEMPDFAIYGEEGAVIQLADPTVPLEGRRIGADRARWEFIEAMERPSAAFFPPVACFAAAAAIQALNDNKLIRNVFWRAQILLRDCQVVSVKIKLGNSAQLGLEYDSVDDESSALGAHLLFVRTRAMMAWLSELTGDDARSVVARIPAEKIKHLKATLPAEAAFREENLEPATAAERLNEEFTCLRAQFAKRALALRADWRVDNRPRRDAELVREALIGCRAVYPLRKKKGVRDFGVTLPVSEFGGIERGKGNYAAALRARGWRPHLFITRASSAHLSPLAFEAFESVNFLCVEEAEKTHPKQHYFGVWTSDFGSHSRANDVLGLLGSMDAIVNNHSFATHSLAARLRRFGTKMYVGVHMTERTPAGNPLGTPHSILGYEHAYDGIIVISDMLREWCIGQGVPAEKLHLVRNAPSYPNGSHAITRSLLTKKRKNGPLRVLFLGRTRPAKRPRSFGRNHPAYERRLHCVAPCRKIGA